MTAVSIAFNAQLEVGPIKRRRTEERKKERPIRDCTKAFLNEKRTPTKEKLSSQFHLLFLQVRTKVHALLDVIGFI